MVIVICHPGAECCVTDGLQYPAALERLSIVDGGGVGERGSMPKVEGVEEYSPLLEGFNVVLYLPESVKSLIR